MEVDGNRVGIYDGIVTIFTGYGDDAKIKRFILTANGTEEDQYVTLEDCRKMIGETESTVTVIFDGWLHGEIYKYGSYKDEWIKYGTTQGFA